MKHNVKVTVLLILLFLAAHSIGFLILENYVGQDLPLGLQAPDIDAHTAYVPLFLAVLIATAIAFIFIKFNAIRFWKYWFFISVWLCLSLAFAAFLSQVAAVAIAAALAYWKIFKPNPYVHNATELFIYGGLAALFVPLLTIKATAILLILISVYDVVAVFKTKHMVSLANFQRTSNVFAGLHVPYKQKATKRKLPSTKKGVQEAVLGGGDIGFPLLFSGAVYMQAGFVPAFIVSCCAALGLLALFTFAKGSRYYPAMPAATLGCFAGYVLLMLL